jgi:hypothetical protein
MDSSPTRGWTSINAFTTSPPPLDQQTTNPRSTNPCQPPRSSKRGLQIRESAAGTQIPSNHTRTIRSHHQRRLLLSAPTGDLRLSLPCTLRTRERCSRSCCSSFLAACDPPGWGKCRISWGELSSTTTLSPESRFAVRLRRCCRFDRRCVSVVSIGRVVVGGVVSVRVSAKSLLVTYTESKKGRERERTQQSYFFRHRRRRHRHRNSWR